MERIPLAKETLVSLFHLELHCGRVELNHIKKSQKSEVPDVTGKQDVEETQYSATAILKFLILEQRPPSFHLALSSVSYVASPRDNHLSASKACSRTQSIRPSEQEGEGSEDI